MLRISGVLALVTSLAATSACTNRDVGRDERAPAQPLEPTPTPTSEGGGAVSSEASEPTPAPLERRVAASLGVALRAPADWRASEQTIADAPAFALVSARAGEGFASNVNVVREPLPRTTALAAYAEASGRLLAGLEGYREASEAEVELAGHPAVRREYEHAQASARVWAVSYVLIVEREAFVITASAAASSSEAERARLDTVARSFEFVSSEAQP